MTREVRAKIFKSGNSVALRLPKAWGFVAGEEVDLIPDGKGGYEIRRIEDLAALIDALYGSFSPDFMADGRGDTEQDERN